MASPLKINGNGLANATGKQLLQIVPINIVVVVTIIGAAVGLYWKFDARLTSLEKSPLAMTPEERNRMTERIKSTEDKLNELAPNIIETHTNVLWLMNQQKGANPR